MQLSVEKEKWGFLRETREDAKKAGIDLDTGLHRTGLEEYLGVIFPDVADWVHDKSIPNSNRKTRPDYRSESLKLIVEFDGMPHYQNPDVVFKDRENMKVYEALGYKVVRIPYFIQLTKTAIRQMFGVEMDCEMFNENIPSLGKKGRNSPAYLCFEGLKRMASDFKKYPEQYRVNVEFMKSQNDDFFTGVSLLEYFYEKN